MNTRKLWMVVMVLAAAALACEVNIKLPNTSLKTGETITEVINVPSPGGDDVTVSIGIGGGELNINPGAQDGLVVGTVTYNVADFKPNIFYEGSIVNVEQGKLELNTIPSFDANIKNEWNLALANDPITLRLTAGAYKGTYELGGLSLKSLYIKDGAANVDLSFSRPNNVEMGILDYSTGASNVKLTGLSNANFGTMVFQSGLGNYTLDFSGELQRDGIVSITSGLSNVKIIIPSYINAKVTVGSGLTNVSTEGGWTQTGKTYTQTGSGPTLTLSIDIGAGQLELSN